MTDTDALNAISEGIRAEFDAKNRARDGAINASRELIRLCSEAIRAIHRRDYTDANARLDRVGSAAAALRAALADHPDLLVSGYTRDALKEVVEAFITVALIRGEALPTPAALNVEGSVYLNGLAEAATELRRFILDILRRADGDPDEAERLLNWMDAIYDQLVTFDFPDAVTGDLRRRTDVVRGVLERTRGDVTTTFQQQRLQAALDAARRAFAARDQDDGG